MGEAQNSLDAMQEMLALCVQALKSWVSEGGWPQDAEDEQGWARLFGKESVAGALAKLVAMHKSLSEQQHSAREQAQQAQASHAPLTEAEWHLLALCVRRHFEAQE